MKVTKWGILITMLINLKISFEIDSVNVNSRYYGLDQWKLGPLDCWTFLDSVSLSFFSWLSQMFFFIKACVDLRSFLIGAGNVIMMFGGESERDCIFFSSITRVLALP